MSIIVNNVKFIHRMTPPNPQKMNTIPVILICKIRDRCASYILPCSNRLHSMHLNFMKADMA